MSKRGLPETVRMRHEAHYVETLSASSGKPIGRMVPIDRVDPNPDQPRQVMGESDGAEGFHRREGNHRTVDRAAAAENATGSSPANGATRPRCSSA